MSENETPETSTYDHEAIANWIFGRSGCRTYDDWQAEVHDANLMVSSWRNCPCDGCRAGQAEEGYPLAEFAIPTGYKPFLPACDYPVADYGTEPPF